MYGFWTELWSTFSEIEPKMVLRRVKLLDSERVFEDEIIRVNGH